jgi:hypothetical protein
VFRLTCGFIALLIAFVAVPRSQASLRYAVAGLGAFILLHQGLELYAWRLLSKARGSSARESAASMQEAATDSFSTMASALISTPGVVLGLLVVFAPEALLTDTIRVSAVALAVSLLLAVVVTGLTAISGHEDPPLSTLVRGLFNVTLWALALGLLGISMALVVRK